jgi:hypothetical protein
MMDADSEQLRTTVQCRAVQGPGRTERLGEALNELMENWISPQQARVASAVELWDSLLPAELRWHCKITEISRGQLKILVDSPSYVYELQLCSSELLAQLQQQCPQAHIKKLKFIVG